jgi:hypothetical protein
MAKPGKEELELLRASYIFILFHKMFIGYILKLPSAVSVFPLRHF